jgi:5-methylcytosine-specific restriction endonuclease McrA
MAGDGIPRKSNARCIGSRPRCCSLRGRIFKDRRGFSTSRRWLGICVFKTGEKMDSILRMQSRMSPKTHYQKKPKKRFTKFKPREDLKALRNKWNDPFFQSQEWRTLRWRVLKLGKFKCKACGMDSASVRLHVDHIKPRSKYPNLALDMNNLQILCESCNLGKSDKE